MDNIKVVKIWQDEDFFEISVTCENKMISASTKVYVTDLKIEQLQNEISQFLQHKKSEIFWASGERGESSTPCVEFRFFMKDSGGHVLIECFMELDDGGNLDKHNCCFFVDAELGMLHDFNSKLSALKTSQLGVSASFLDEAEWV